jgi:predicted enzyme related to lactoylglutathione lyase
MSNSVTHFEIFAEDLARLAQFYRDLFGWRIEKAAGVDYFRIQTGPPDDKAVSGGMMHRPIEGPKS